MHLHRDMWFCRSSRLVSALNNSHAVLLLACAWPFVEIPMLKCECADWHMYMNAESTVYFIPHSPLRPKQRTTHSGLRLAVQYQATRTRSCSLRL